ncbi:unnamed protein product [Laminaria digitata]
MMAVRALQCLHALIAVLDIYAVLLACVRGCVHCLQCLECGHSVQSLSCCSACACKSHQKAIDARACFVCPRGIVLRRGIAGMRGSYGQLRPCRIMGTPAPLAVAVPCTQSGANPASASLQCHNCA